MLELEGSISDIIFRNEGNGWTVAVLDTEDGDITIVGVIPFLRLNENLKAKGEMVYHKQFGEQFKISEVFVSEPDDVEKIKKYLSSGLIPHIGPKMAERIINKFGLETMDVINGDLNRLLEVEGIGEKKLEAISIAISEQVGLRKTLIFLQKYDISTNYALKIYKMYGEDTIKILSINPYRLATDIIGIGFKRADEIARKMGIDSNSLDRIEAGLKYILLKESSEGHSFLFKNELLLTGEKLLEVDRDLLEQGLRDLSMKDQVYVLRDGDEHLIYYKPFHLAENYIANKLMEISEVRLENSNFDVDKWIERIENTEDMRFADRQKSAIREVINNGVTVITGGPGTGKTTVINGIIKICMDLGLKVELAAPTGRAAKRMTEATGKSARTLHRLLEYSHGDENIMSFGRDEDNPLEADVLIVDEASMIDLLLMNHLMHAIERGIRLVLVGDIDQLPSVGAGNVLRDIINSDVIKVVELNEIYRQARESMIIVNAHRVNQGEMPLNNVREKDFFFMPKSSGEEILQTILSLVSGRISEHYGYDSCYDIQILSPMKKTDLGTINLNKKLQERLNPPSAAKKELKFRDEVFREGDKVMQIKNNYSLEWETFSEDGTQIEKGEGVFNGDIGRILEINEVARSIKVIFDEEKVLEYEFSNLDELKLSYASTVHKAQGSEFPVVIIPIYSAPPMLLTRNLIYTAITRAKELVILVGSEKWLKWMIENNSIRNRNSALNKKLEELYKIKGLGTGE